MLPVIVLLTDFGHVDPYVGQMKGVLLCHAPQATIVDLCHEVRAQDVRQAGFLLQGSCRHFPAGSVFVCVVDPGVGSARDILLAEFGGRLFLAPDNGLLSFLLDEPARWWRTQTDMSGASRTFHGRDVFAGLAAGWLWAKRRSPWDRPSIPGRSSARPWSGPMRKVPPWTVRSCMWTASATAS